MRKLLFILLLTFLSGKFYAQYDTLHYIAPVAYSYWNNKTEIVLSTASNQSATVRVYKSDGTHLFDTAVVKGNPVRHILENSNPFQELLANNNVLSAEGIFVQADLPVSVNIRDIANNTFATHIKGNYSMNSKGSNAVGTSFHLIGYRSTSLIYGILALEDNTTVLISNTSNQSIQLNKGESFLINSIGTGNNLGTLVKSNKNISMTSSASFEAPGGCGDAIADQLIPSSLAGTDYLIVKGRGNSTLEQFSIVAIESNTTVNVSGSIINLANSGDFVTLTNGVNIHDVKVVKSDKPILVAQGSGVSCEADQAILPPVNCTGSRVIETKDFLGLNYEVYVLTHPQYVPTLNGTPLSNPITIDAQWVMYIFNQSQVAGNSILLECESMMQCGVLQSGSGYSMFGYFSGFTKPSTVKIHIEVKNLTNELLEGCETADLIIERDDASAEEYISIKNIGTSTNGVDYEEITSVDTLIVGQFSDTIKIKPKYDYTKEGKESIIFSIDYIDHCSGENLHFDSTLYIQDYIQISNSTIDPILFCDKNQNQVELTTTISNGIPPYTYSWSNVVNNTDYQIVNSNQLHPNKNVFTLTVLDACNQTSNIHFEVYKQCEIEPSNIITANGDGVNDNFVIKNLEDYDNVEFEVLDRWGSIVYFNSSYDNSFKGLTNSGHKLADGVYFYRIKVANSPYKYSNSKKENNVITGFLQIEW